MQRKLEAFAAELGNQLETIRQDIRRVHDRRQRGLEIELLHYQATLERMHRLTTDLVRLEGW